MLKKRIAVLRGGPSDEYHVSLRTGAAVIAALQQLDYNVFDITVTKTGEWLMNGISKPPEQLLASMDMVFIAMHGAYGEDGTVQKICERLHIPFTGSNAFPSSLAFNKDAAKKQLRESGIKMPRHVRVSADIFDSYEIFTQALARAVGSDLIVKPISNGSSTGVTLVSSIDSLREILLNTFADYSTCLIEERIRGTEATCGILENFRGENHYILPPIEIVPPPTDDFYSQSAKYESLANEICPGHFSYLVRERLGNAALTAHTMLGLSHYSRSDFIVRNDDVYFLEINTLPALTDDSLFSKAVATIGLPYVQLIDHLVSTAKVR